MDDTEMTAIHDSSTNPVLLLPPSTTTTAVASLAQDDNDDDDMDFETPKIRKRYPSGLANLGNTCFMNSTLQCLSHTDPLRRYFVTSDYQADLNRDNPLGTGGELATEFSNLLREMWISKPGETVSTYDVAYPRSFKQALGRHAEQFMGYDQHDSQEFATYLLDALHEDTNRITKKPYIEKPEQKENETDDEAAEVAWKLHLQREDSRVLENFMGQVKSRVQCPTDGCGRVSTTFDPFMYLSVPIPGATDVTIPVTLVTLEDGNFKFNITINKTATIEGLQKKVASKFKALRGKDIAMENLICADIWHGHVYSYHEPDECVDKIVISRDVTHIYEIKSTEEVMRGVNDFDRAAVMEELETKHTYRPHRLDDASKAKLNVGNKWMDELGKYLTSAAAISLMNPKRSSHEQRVAFYKKLQQFLYLCHCSSDGHDSESNASDDADMTTTDGNPQDEPTAKEESKYESCPSLEERCQSSSVFRNVKDVHDLAVLEHCSTLVRDEIVRLAEEEAANNKEGIVIEVSMRKKNATSSYGTNTDSGFAFPLCLRISPNMTVYSLREELASRLSECLKTDYLSRKPPPPTPPSEAMDTKIAASDVTPDESNGGSDQSEAVPMETSTTEQPSGEGSSQAPPSMPSLDLGSPELLILRQIPLTHDRGTNNRSRSAQLGMLETSAFGSLDGHPTTLAIREDESEQQAIADVVLNRGAVRLNWPQELCDRAFDVKTYEAAEIVEDPEQASRMAEAKTITVKDCIDKYCLMEQLDETEMWYCNRCKDHVRAWKQFHLYRAPPILIVHLKRFHYSPTTHRRDKIDTFIDFPLTGLDLTNEFTHWNEDEKPVYDCYAVSNHFGGLGGGHYTAFALSDEGTWSNFDDSRVTTDVDPKDVVSSAAYCLYYRRRDVELDGPEGEVNPPLPAIVEDSFFQPQEDSNERLDMDDGLGTDFHSATESSNRSVSSQMESEDIDPYGTSDFQDEIGTFKSNLPLQ